MIYSCRVAPIADVSTARLTYELSYGERGRIAIVGVMAMRPRGLLFAEPVSVALPQDQRAAP